MKGHKIPDQDRLHHILAATEFILSQTSTLSDDNFYRDEVLKRAVVRDLEVIGEAANMISEELKERHAEVPWRQIVATRHRIIHEYFHVNYVTVWGIIQNDLPELQKKVRQILKEVE